MNNESFILGFAKRAAEHKIDSDVIADIIRKYFGIGQTHLPNPKSTAQELVDQGGTNNTNNIV